MKGSGFEIWRCAPLPLILLVAQPLSSAVITVNATCTLAAAIEAANEDRLVGSCAAGSGADTIRLTTDVGLTSGPYFAEGPNGLPSVTSEIVVAGSGKIIYRDADSAFRLIYVSSEGFLTLQDVSIIGGLAGSYGGGIYNSGRLWVFDSFVSANQASSRGGGIYHASGAQTWIRDSTLALNEAKDSFGAEGGAIYAVEGDYLLIERSTLRQNLAEGPLLGANGGAVFAVSVPSLIEASTVSDNTARASSNAKGGGVYGDATWINNSTISGNTVERTSTGATAGGGFYCAGSNCRVDHSTFVGNTADIGGALSADGLLLLIGSLLASSTGGHCAGEIVDGGYGNLADDTSCLPTISGTLTGLDPVLADNGGPTRTHALDEGSLAVDLAGPCDFASDQRGAARVGSCDSGAYEWVSCLGEIENKTVSLPTTYYFFEPCHTVIIGPDVLVEETGGMTIKAGHLVTIMNGLEIETGGELAIQLYP